MESGHRFWVVGFALLAAMLVLLVAALFLNDRLRPRVETVPPATSAAAGPLATAISTPALATASPSSLPVGTSPLEREIEAAYLRYWEVRSRAYLNLDPSLLPEVLAGAKLAREEKQIRDLQAQGRAAKLDVDHRIAFVSVAEDRAVVYDEYLNKSVFIDASTGKELATSLPPTTEKVSVEMRKLNGVWKVVDGAQHE